ncbi:MAG: DNA polymerase III subunit delta' [Pleurocapsa sp.]
MTRDLIGQDKAIDLLKQAVALDRIAPAYLFYGSPGIGKSMAGRNFSQMLLSQGLSAEKCLLVEKKLQSGNHPDLLWVQPTYQHQGQTVTAQEALDMGLKRKTPPKIRIEQIREIAQFLSRPALEASRQVVVMEEAETMTEAAANALLKTLEEPGKATLILIAPSLDALLSTLVSRCQLIPFNRLSQENLKLVLQRQGYTEILEHQEIMAIAQGSPGDAIASWYQLQSISPELLQQLLTPPSNPLTALQIARAIANDLEASTQLWLVDYLQYYYWHRSQNSQLMAQWETTRKYLLSYVQPRLVWECTLLNLVP